MHWNWLPIDTTALHSSICLKRSLEQSIQVTWPAVLGHKYHVLRVLEGRERNNVAFGRLESH